MFFKTLLLAASLVTVKDYSVDDAGKFVGTGRLGDKTLVLSKAQWVSYKYGIPFTYLPFEGMEQFSFYDTNEQHTFIHQKRKHSCFANTKHPKSDKTCYIVNMLWQDGGWDDPIEVGLWHTAIHDHGYKQALRQSLRPKIAIPKLQKKETIPSVQRK